MDNKKKVIIYVALLLGVGYFLIKKLSKSKPVITPINRTRAYSIVVPAPEKLTENQYDQSSTDNKSIEQMRIDFLKASGNYVQGFPDSI